MAQALIVVDPKIMMGKPTVAGTRITVELTRISHTEFLGRGKTEAREAIGSDGLT
jgi:hypothetical protein